MARVVPQKMQGRPVIAPQEVANGNQAGSEPGRTFASANKTPGRIKRCRARQRLPSGERDGAENVLIRWAAEVPGSAESAGPAALTNRRLEGQPA